MTGPRSWRSPSARHMAAVVAVVLLTLGLAVSAAAPPPAERCASDRLRAASRLAKAAAVCESRAAKKPAARFDLAGCRARGDARFDKSYAKAADRLQRRGGSCANAESAAELRGVHDADLDALVADILAGVDPIDKEDNRLRATLLKHMGTLAGKLLANDGANEKKRDPVRRAAVTAKLRTAFAKQAGKALVRALGRGVAYAGPDASGIAERVDVLVNALVDMLTAARRSFSGTIFAADSTFADGDVNTPESPFELNDFLERAQAVPTPATVGGYVNIPGEGPPGPSQAPGDVVDYFEVSVNQGDQIVLYIGDDPSVVDLDLCLFTGEGVLSDCSQGVSGTEVLSVPATGTFFVAVFPFFECACASTYVLTIGQPLVTSLPPTMRLRDDFVPGDVLVALAERGPMTPARAARDRVAAARAYRMAARGGSPRRAMLWALGDEQERDATFDALGARHAYRLLRQQMRAMSRDDRLRFDTILAAKALRRRADVAAADLNYVRRALVVPNDPQYPSQWHYPLMDLPQAWDLTTGDPGVTVAVIDTGVVLAHPDLAGQLVAGYDFISDAANAGDGDEIDPDPDDPGDGGFSGSSSFHGTHVAGTVAAASNNGVGVAGVAWNARIMPLRVLGRNGGTDFDLIQAAFFAAGLDNDSETKPAARADVINMSLGGPGFSQVAQDAFTAVRDQGVIIVAAAGNSASSLPFYPAAFDGVVSVSAVDFAKDLAWYSNFGDTVDVAAPGGDTSRDLNGDGFGDGVLSTRADDSGETLRFIYDFQNGTSMAAPHVAGVVALMKSVAPALTPNQFDALLASGAITEDLGAAGRDGEFGHGLINARAAVVAASGPPPAPVPVLVVTPTALNFGSQLGIFSIEARNPGGGALKVTGVSEDSTGWLAVAADPDAIDGEGLGTYLVSVDRSGLAAGTYGATIDFASTENGVSIPVVMRVGGATESDAGVHFVLLVDAETGETADQVIVQVSGGTYVFEFTEVPPGEYLVIAGTDHDNDLFVCDAGEACGAFPTLDLMTPLSADERHSNLDFGTGFQSAIGASGVGESHLPRHGFRRLELPAGDAPR